jgi:hypothetical protein
VKKMCEDTRSRIKILEGVPGTPERIVWCSSFSPLLYNPASVSLEKTACIYLGEEEEGKTNDESRNSCAHVRKKLVLL